MQITKLVFATLGKKLNSYKQKTQVERIVPTNYNFSDWFPHLTSLFSRGLPTKFVDTKTKILFFPLILVWNHTW